MKNQKPNAEDKLIKKNQKRDKKEARGCMTQAELSLERFLRMVVAYEWFQTA